MYLLYLASQKKIPATISITADTGWENDCDMMDGTKTTAEEFYHCHVEPFGKHWNIPTYFVRAIDKMGVNRPSIPDYLQIPDKNGEPQARAVPMYGSNGGQLVQSCTDRWKISAMKQQCRRMGATTARSAQGIHFGERSRRVKGQYVGTEDGYAIYQPTNMVKGEVTTVKWLSHYYPLVDLQMDRDAVRREMNRLGLPYLISSECSGCPHADPWRWLRRKPETIEAVAQIEDLYKGEMFFTSERRPLREVIADLRANKDAQSTLFGDVADFGCTDGVCGV